MNENNIALKFVIFVFEVYKWNEIFTLTWNYLIVPALVCTLKFVNSFARRQHLFETPVVVDSNFRSYPAPLSLFRFRPKSNHLICWWCWLSPANFIEIRYCFKTKEICLPMAQDRHQDRYRDRQSKNIMHPLQHRLRRHKNLIDLVNK